MSRHPLLLSSRGKSLSRQGFSAAAARHLGDIQVTMQNVPSAPKAPRTSASPRSPVELPKQYTSPYSGLGISFCAPQEVEMSAAASEGESGDEADDSAGRYPSAVAAPSETDAELSAMLLRAAKEIGLEVPKTPPADPSRLDDWFLGRAPRHRRALPSAFLPGAPLPSPLSTAVQPGVMRRSLRSSALSRCIYARPALPPGGIGPISPSRACEFSSALAGRTYHAAGQAATALHAMATLQVYQAKVLKHLHERGSDQGAMEELRAATDFALRATKVTARSLGRPFGDTVEDFAQQFSVVQKQTEAIKHILPRRDIPTMSAGPQPPPARRRGRTPAASKQPAPSPAKVHDPRLAARRRAGRGRAAPPASQGPVTRKKSAKQDLLQEISGQPGGGENRSLGDDNINVPRPILDLRALNRSLLRLPFKMLTTKRMLTCIRPQDWFAAIDLKDAYFHVSILPRHRPFLRFAFEGRAYQYKVLPFGLSLSPRVFTKVAEAALSPLWQTGIRILNYLDDWLLIAHSRDLLCEQRTWCSGTSAIWAFRSTERRANSPQCRGSLFSVWSWTRSRLLGHMAAAAAVTPLGLLHMRPLQRWLHDRVPRWAWHRGTLRIGVSPQCRRLFSPWSDPAFLQAGVPWDKSPGILWYTRMPLPRVGVLYAGQAASGSWTGPRLQWHINCLELLAVLLALRPPTDVASQARACSTDSTATVAYINRQGGLRAPSHVTTRPPSAPMESNVAEITTCRSHSRRTQPCSRPALTAVHPSWRMATPPRDSPANLEPFREAQIDLFASPNPPTASGSTPSTRLPTASAGTHWHTAGLRGPNTVQDQGGRGAGSAGCAILAHPDLVSRTHFPRGSPSLENPLEERPSFSGDGPLAPAPRSVEPARLVPGRDASDLSGLPQAVIETITQSRAPSTRQAYALRWGLFVDWCSSRGEDPQRCTIAVVLSFLQEKLERRLSPSTLKVYVAAIAAYHDAVDGTSLGKHQLIVRFLRGARRVNPPRPHPIPSWDLSVALQGLREAPFEPLASVELKYLSLKTALLTALASIKRVGDLQAFSVDEACLEFGPGDSHVILRPRPGYVPKVPTTPFRVQVVNLQALPLEEADPASALLCPVRALRIYVDRTRHFRCTEQLFVCFGGQQKGNAVSKQRLAHWVVDAISLSYQNQGEPCPLGVRAHSTRSVASSYALAHGASLADICRAAGWATPNTFARFYNLRVEAVSSRVLT
ncbi:Gag-Pol polyprotein [Labeo rohita]|uniref:ribonuclease H n=1 Tax=Labeo rohita TaxID=84645 RepID=A0ABQ8MLV3_LABRO|nr:Gag-Pol polyprotein [Labeo rohita]